MKVVEREFELKKDVVLRNPIVMAPMTTYSSNPDGTVANIELDYYRYRNNNGGMVITGGAAIKSDGCGFINQLRCDSDIYIEGMAKLASVIKEQGALAVMQVFHAGRMALRESIGNEPMVCASAVPSTRPGAEIPKELNEKEIFEIIDCFYQATKRVIKAGFDGIEIHGANTYLIQQFFSPHSNCRNDQWGGTLEKRMKFPLEVIRIVNQAAEEMGVKNFVIGYRISLEEIEEQGITLSDSLKFIDCICNEKIDYLHLSLKKGYDQGSLREPESKIQIGKSVLDVVNNRMPVIGNCFIMTEDDCERALAFGYSMVSLGRAFIINTDWEEKILKGEVISNYITYEQALERKIPINLINMIEQIESWKYLIKK